MVYVELWFDAEKDQEWKITLWKIPDYDFDPMTAPYLTLETNTDNQHIAREVQLEIVRDLKHYNDVVVANAYMDRSRFQIRPKWFEELLSPIGARKRCRNIPCEKSMILSNIKETYTIWFKNISMEVS